MTHLPSPAPGKPEHAPSDPGDRPGESGLADAAATAASLAAEVRRLASRYRRFSETRLRALDARSGQSWAAAGRLVAQRLADLADPGVGRVVPDAGPFAVGDQIAVTGRELVERARDEAALAAGRAAVEELWRRV